MELIDYLKTEGYSELREIEGRGLCGIMRFAFTVGLVYGMTKHGYTARYCYPDMASAKEALSKWDGKDDPDDDIWIKHKGLGVDSRNKNKKI